MPSVLFYLFAILMLAGGVCVVAMKNPVSSAMGMIGSFIGIAALLIGLNAYFVGTLQVLVYAGAIMVLFVFIIMLLDLKKEKRTEFSNSTIAAGIIVPLLMVLITIPVLQSIDTNFSKLDGKALVAAEGQLPEEIAKTSIIRQALLGSKDAGTKDFVKAAPSLATLPDVNLIGQKLYTDYNFPLQVVAVLLLVATIGCVALSKKLHGDEAPAGDIRMAKTKPKSDKIPVAPALTVVAGEVEDTTKAESNDIDPEVISVQDHEMPKEEREEKTSGEADTIPEQKAQPTSEELPENSSLDDKKGLIYSQRPDSADDLKIISGVGPVLEQKLNDIGIYTYKQVADWSPENIAIFDNLISFPGRIERDSWQDQAKKLHDQKYS